MSKVTINGLEYTLKPYTRPNHNAVIEGEAKLQDRLATSEIDRFEYYIECLKLVIADGPVDKLNPETVDGREAEAVFFAFWPESMQTLARLIGF
jgi:hypothetical protein